MATEINYVLPVDQTGWHVKSEFDTRFTWDYDDGRDGLLKLYDKGKKQQWDAAERIDWSIDLDPENPMGMPDESLGIMHTDVWRKMTKKERTEYRVHVQARNISQFLHGEQGALVCTAKIVQEVPHIDAKFYAATQVIDEARHVEAYSRLLREKFPIAYPITKPLASLLENIITDNRWDFTYLGMQVLIEGLALAAFEGIRNQAQNRLAAQVNAYVMQDEARHVAFGRLALRDYYPQLTQAERDEREEFVVEACYFLRDRFTAVDIWECLGLPVDELLEETAQGEAAQKFRHRLFTRIVPTVKDIGLWGPKVQKAYADMGIIEYGNIDAGKLLEQDNRVADMFDTDMNTDEIKAMAMKVAAAE